MTRIDELEAGEIVGNAHDDQSLLDLADQIICDAGESLAVRGRALRMLDRIMGLESPARCGDADVVRELVAYLNDR